MPIGRVAELTGVKVPTIRYYEEIGLLPTPDRAGNNRRTYGQDTLRRLRFIRHARELGFEVEAIRQLLSFGQEPHQPCDEADRIARAHLADIESKIARLTALGAEVKGVARSAGVRNGVEIVAEGNVEKVLKETDALVMILPGSESTKHALNAQRYARCGDITAEECAHESVVTTTAADLPSVIVVPIDYSIDVAISRELGAETVAT